MSELEVQAEGALKGLVLDDGQIFRPLKEVNRLGGARLVPERTEVCGGISRHRFDKHVEKQINHTINVCYNMSYQFHAMSSYFNRDCVSLRGLAYLFYVRSAEERQRAFRLSNYLAKRGGHVVLKTVEEPEQQEFRHEEKGDALHAMELTVCCEKAENEKFLELNKAAEDVVDEELSDYLTDNFMKQQTKLINEHSNYVTQLRRVGKGHGEYHWDRDLYMALTHKHPQHNVSEFEDEV